MEKQEEVIRTKDGKVDVLAQIAETFKGQPEVIEYVQDMARGYALQKSIQSIESVFKFLNNKKSNLKGSISIKTFIPQELAPKIYEKVTPIDTN
jgi:hypothetical protein|tara:strand:- start:878 stop:1159 length:282 start_codon:yes stop_codon:yes gene_type:complete